MNSVTETECIRRYGLVRRIARQDMCLLTMFHQNRSVPQKSWFQLSPPSQDADIGVYVRG